MIGINCVVVAGERYLRFGRSFAISPVAQRKSGVSFGFVYIPCVCKRAVAIAADCTAAVIRPLIVFVGKLNAYCVNAGRGSLYSYFAACTIFNFKAVTISNIVITYIDNTI